MKRLFTLPLALIGLLIAALTPTTAGAGEMLFGADDQFHKIQEVRIDGVDYDLAHRTTIYFFVAGVYLTDGGYVLREKGEDDWYIPLGRYDIAELQASGDLPDPMPGYSVPILDYVIGYSLWLVIAFTVISPLFAKIGAGKRAAHRARKLLDDPDYQEALRIAEESGGDGFNEAVDYLLDRRVPLDKAHADLKFLLERGEALAA